MNVIPEDLVDVVHHAAAGTTEYTADLVGIERRWRRRRRRRVVASVAGVAVLVAVSLAAVPVLGSWGGASDVPPAAVDRPAQRLMIQGYESLRMGENGPESGVALPVGTAFEILPDGTVARWTVPGKLVARHVVGLPDGRVVVAGREKSQQVPAAPPVSPPPRGERRSFAWTNPGSDRLLVLSRDGTVELARSLGTGGVTRLVAATAETAYLLRPAGLVAHTLATGQERVLAAADQIADDYWAEVRDADVVGDRALITGERQGGCYLTVLDLRTGSTTGHPVTLGACHEVWMARMSPDGRLAAVSYQRAVDEPMRLAIVDLATGVSRLDVATPVPGKQSANVGFGEAVGMAWPDDAHVRVAMARPPDADRVYPLDQVLHPHTFDVG